MSDIIKIWIIHNREEEGDRIAKTIRQVDPQKEKISIQLATWVKDQKGKFLRIDESHIVVIHEGILEDVDGQQFFNKKRNNVEHWIIIKGIERYKGKLISNISKEEYKFQYTNFHWKEFFDKYEFLKTKPPELLTLLCYGKIPLRLEYFLELSLRLGLMQIKQDIIIKNIMQKYKEKSHLSDANELKIFGEVENLIEGLLSGKTESDKVQTICDKLLFLSKKELSEWLNKMSSEDLVLWKLEI
jgi:hypothetical protein